MSNPRSIGFSLLLVGLASCAPRLTTGAACETSDSCAAPLVCRLGRCRAECVTQRDCPIGAICLLDSERRGSCRLPDEEACVSNAECPLALMCIDGQCSNPCTTVAECPPDSRCEPSADGRARCVRADADGGMSDVGADANTDVGGTCMGASCAVEVVVTERSSCLRDGTEGVSCWGRQEFLAATGPERCEMGIACATQPVPARYVPSGTTAVELTDTTALAGNRDVVCAIEGGRAVCWGLSFGPLGNGDSDGTVGRAVSLGSASPLPMDALELSVGETAGWVRRAGGQEMWGSNALREFGMDTTGTDFPYAITGGPTGDVVRFGGAHGCALRSGRVFCWGENDLGQAGGMTLGTGAVVAVPTEVSLPLGGAETVVEVAPGRAHTCVLTSTGAVWCWGWVVVLPDITDTRGCTTVGFDIGCPTPRRVAAGARPVQHLASSPGANVACTIDDMGLLLCWGSSVALSFGDAANTPRPVPGLPPVASAALGQNHGCAITRLGSEVWCWGMNEMGQLGRGTFTAPPTVDLTAAPVVFR